MCEGRCREPRCIRSPGRGSQRLHRALSGTRILLAAAPTAPPCFCRCSGRCCCTGGFLPAGLFGGSMLFESTLASPFSRQIKQKLQYPVRILESLVGAGGFEPPKLKAADLQSVPIGHSGTRPYSFSQSRGLPVYVTTESAICQPIIWAARKKYIAITKALPSGYALQRPGRRAFQPDKKSGEDHFWFFM